MAVKVTEEPSQIVVAVVLIDTEVFTTALTVTNALPVIEAEHTIEAVLLATTEYVPTDVWFPNEIAEPVPATLLPISEPLRCN